MSQKQGAQGPKVPVEFLHFNRVMKTTGEVLTEMERLDYRPVTIFEQSTGRWTGTFPIVFPGSVLQDSSGRRVVPCLDWSGMFGEYGKKTTLLFSDGPWGMDFCFAAVRK